MILNLEQAMQLYELLEDYLPKMKLDFNLLDFVAETVENMKSKQRYDVYFDAVSLMTGYDTESMIANNDPEDVLKYFIDGLIENDIVRLITSMEKLGYGK